MGMNPESVAMRRWQTYVRRLGYWRKSNTVTAIVRLQRKIERSKAHVVKPRPADFERWRQMEAHLAELKANLAGMPEGGDPPLNPPVRSPHA
jgi:hypothetical protein